MTDLVDPTDGNPREPARAPCGDGLDALFARNLPRLVAFLRARVGGAVAARESIHDLAQSVCREVLADRDRLRFDSDEAFRAYLFLQASRKVVDRARFHGMAMRDPAREGERLSVAEARELLAGVEQVSPSRAAASKEQLERVEEAIRALPENQSEAVMLSRMLGIPYPEIAAQMGLSEAAVRGLTARGLATLAARLGSG